ncbi:MAG: hypothetical protein KDI46_08495 [Alphaproteobacteria bacterium]|nr:hypothetical protein [Alphaproteobacteria bacterium]
MKRKILSFGSAAAIAVFLMMAAHWLNTTDGQAQASASRFAAGVPEKYSAGKRRQLRRSVSISPASIVDLSGRDIIEILHEPELVRKDLPTVIWQYRNKVCTLDLFFTAAKDDVLNSPVVHYEMRARSTGEDVQPAQEKKCMGALVRSGKNNFKPINFQAFYKAGV